MSATSLRSWLRKHLDPLEVYRSYVKLRRSGKNWVGLCPLHPERTPSFYVYTDSGTFYCFGCKRWGDEISFLQQVEHLDLGGALRLLEQRWSVPPPPWKPRTQEERMSRALGDLLEWAWRCYQRWLATPEAEHARAYLLTRGLTPETWQRYGLGYAPAGGRRLYEAATRVQRVPDWLIRQSGLWMERDAGWVDFFRDRVVFPVHDASGKIMALAGRALQEDAPKYLNSPETLLFKKSQAFFGLGWALEALHRTRQVYLVEGYFDALLMHAAGYENTLAVLGSHLSGENARWLMRHVESVVLVFDGDAAGRQAAWESLQQLLPGLLQVRVTALPEGSDPAQVLARGEEGRTLMAQFIDHSRPWTGFVAEYLREKYGPDFVKHGKALEAVFTLLAPIARDSRARAMACAREMAEAMGIRPGDVLYGDFLRWLKRKRSRARGSVEAGPTPQDAMEIPFYERELFFGLLQDPTWFEALLAERGVDVLRAARLRRVLEFMLDRWYEGQTVDWGQVVEAFEGEPEWHWLHAMGRPGTETVSMDAFHEAVLHLYARYYRIMSGEIERDLEPLVNGTQREERAQTILELLKQKHAYLKAAVEIEKRLGFNRNSGY